MRKVYFISSLPRSGSTLTCNILAQNPKFFSTETSGCLDVLFGIRNSWNSLIEHKAHPKDECKLRVMRAVLNTYHNTDREIVFDKSRGWLAYLELAENIIGENAKVIVNIRPLPDILASFEKMYRATAALSQPPGEQDNYIDFQSMDGRCQYLLRSNNVLGLAINRLRDAFRRGYEDRIHLVDFNKLTKNPKATINELYDFLGEEYFKHDYDNVEQVTSEDDYFHGYLNLHKIQNKVAHKPSEAKEILGEELYNKYNISIL